MMQAEEAGFISYSRSFIVKMQDEGRYDAANKLNMYLRKFITFLGKNDIPFKNFDSLLIQNYNTWLENQKLGRNSISLYIRNLKRVYQLAVAMCYGSIFNSLVALAINTYYTGKLINVGFFKQMRDLLPTIALCLVMFALILTMNHFIQSDIVKLCTGIAVGVAFYTLSSRVLKFSELDELTSLLKKDKAKPAP